MRGMKRQLIARWVRENRHGFADMVREAEARLRGEEGLEPHRWFREELKRLEEWRRQLRAQAKKQWKGEERGEALRIAHELHKVTVLMRDLQRDMVTLKEEMKPDRRAENEYWFLLDLLHRAERRVSESDGAASAASGGEDDDERN